MQLDATSFGDSKPDAGELTVNSAGPPLNVLGVGVSMLLSQQGPLMGKSITGRIEYSQTVREILEVWQVEWQTERRCMEMHWQAT